MMDWKTRKIVDNIWGPTGTTIIHIIVVICLIKFMVVKEREVVSEVEVVIKEIEAFDDLEKIEEELEELDDIPTVVDAVTPPNVSLDQQPPQVDSMAAPGAEGPDMSEFSMMEAVSPLKFRGLYASRSASGRKSALGKYGGGYGGSTEYAVKKALEWLKNHQYPDGSWGPQYRVSMTGLALLCFFAHGDDTSSLDYGDAIKKGLQYLLKRQKGGQFIGGGHSHPSHAAAHPSQINVYEHAIGTYAISEAYGLTQIPFLKFAMEDAVQVLLDGQHDGGHWDYGYRQGPDANMDTSLAGWSLQALKAAYGSGAENRGLKTAIENGVRGLQDMLVKTGGADLFKYSTRENHEQANMTMTGVAVLCMQLTGHALDAEGKAGMKSVQKLQFQWRKGDTKNQDTRACGEWPLYAWYYITQARFHHGARTWATWNKQFALPLCRMQNPDGSWGPAPDSVEQQFGPVYCTTLPCLMLEVYYRFLPTYKPIEVEREKVEETTDEDEIVIKFG